MAGTLQNLVDSAAGQFVGTLLHTVGALAFLAGLVAYLGWYRYLRRGHDLRRVLVAASFLSFAAIGANLLGGFMRTFQSGHPPLADFPHAPWVQVMVVKHLFLFAAMGATAVLFLQVAPRLLRVHQAGRLGKGQAKDHAAAFAVAIIGILVASVLGALAPVMPLPHQEATEPPAVGDPAPPVRYHNVTGHLTTTPLTPRTATGTFEVPRGTDLLAATLLWDGEAELRLGLTGPDGAPAGEAERTGGGVVAVVRGPEAGAWRYEVASEPTAGLLDVAVDVAWELSVRMGPDRDETLLAETVTVAPGAFFEINTEMPEGGSFSWDWHIHEGVAVHFDVHSHFDDEVQYWVEMEASEHEGSFTNDREGGYSLLWANEGTTPVTLAYRVWGEFELHSYFPPR